MVNIAPAPSPHSLNYVREKIDGRTLTQHQIEEVIHDIVGYRYSDMEIAAFLVGCAGFMSTQELLEKEHAARVEARERLEDREQRLDEVVSKTLSGTNPGETSQPLSVEELRGELKANERAMQNEATEFVASYR